MKKAKLDAKTLIFLAMALGAALLLFASGTAKSEKDTGENTSALSTDEDYSQQLQTQLETALCCIQGAGKVKVFLTLESGPRYIYATENKLTSDVKSESDSSSAQKTSEESTLCVVDDGDGRQPVLLVRKEPTVKGVVVLCEGAGIAKVEQSIIEAVTTICAIKSNRVSVCKMA